MVPLAPEHLFLPFAAAFALCAAASGLILTGRLPPRRAAVIRGWPVAEGVVLESSVLARREAGRQRFVPSVRYCYSVGGERFEGSRIGSAAEEGFRKYTRARRLLDGYRAGSPVAVHYDPARPGTAVLDPGAAMTLRPAHAIALLIVSMAALTTVFTIGIAIAGN